MDHIAIMKKSWNMIDKILQGQKTIESRWYKNRYAPWDKISKGDTIYFKDSGEKVSAKADVTKVLQYKNLDEEKFNEIIRDYGDNICLMNTDYDEYYQNKNYCILVFIENPQKLKEPFAIDKSGYGIAAAWMCVGQGLESVKM